MRKIWLLLALVPIVCAASLTRAVQYDPGPPISLSIRASSVKTATGIPVRLTATYADKDTVITTNGVIQQIVDDPVSLTAVATGGQFSKTSFGDKSPADFTFLSLQPGYFAILFTATDSGRFGQDPTRKVIVEITVQQANAEIVPALRVGANPQTIRLDRNGSTTITAQVLGRDQAGKTVKFFATGGVLSAPNAVSDANGLASVQLTATRQDLGTIKVMAYAENSESSTSVEVTLRDPRPRPPDPLPRPPDFPVYQPDFLISVNPSTLPADGHSAADVTVRLTDGVGRGIFRQFVDFNSPGLIIRPMRQMTDINGYARVQLIAPTIPGQALVYAQAGAKRSYQLVTFAQQIPEPTGPPRMFLTVNPTAAPADGTSRIAISVLVLDSNGFAIPNVPIAFASTMGAIQSPRVATDIDGQAGTFLLAPATPGIAAVSARLNDQTAASQVVFQGVVNTTNALDIRSWNEQQLVFATERWYFRSINTPDSSMRSLTILDGNNKPLKQFELSKTSMLVRDQYGAAHGYGTEVENTARIELLKPDGTQQRTLELDIPVGCHLLDLQYAEPAGHLLVTLANPDGSKPEVHLYSPEGKELLNLGKGLEKMPVLALGGDGYLGVALAGGSLRIYNPAGANVADIARTDNLQATAVAISEGGEWIAVAASLAGQTEIPPRVSIYSRQGSRLCDLQVEGIRLVANGKEGLLISTPESTRYADIKTRNITWVMSGGFDRAQVFKGIAVIAGRLRDAQQIMIVSRISLVRTLDGKGLGGQLFNDDFREFRAILPPDDKGQVGIVTNNYTFRFPLPTEKTVDAGEK